MGAGRKSYCRSGDGWRAGGLVCRGGAVSPHSHSVYFTTYGDYSRNKDRIGENLGQFVQEKFLDTQSLIALIRRHEPALLIGNWFSQPDNASRVGQHLLQIMSGFLELTDDARIQRLLKRAVHKAIDKVDLSGTSALMLESMTKNDRHQCYSIR